MAKKKNSSHRIRDARVGGYSVVADIRGGDRPLRGRREGTSVVFEVTGKLPSVAHYVSADKARGRRSRDSKD